SSERHRSVPLRIGVLVDLHWREDAGGHVKCWERFALAATKFPSSLDMTVHFLGAESKTVPLADNVRYRIHEPVFSTARMPFLSHVPDHTDLALFHPGLAQGLPGYDILHTTNAHFAFARTAERVAARCAIPLVNSVHTNIPAYNRVFTEMTVRRLFGDGFIARAMLERARVDRQAEAHAHRVLAAHQEKCAHVLVTRARERRRVRRVMPDDRIGLLHRGVDKALFHPAHRDRAWLERTFGIPQDRVLVFYAGRVDPGKNVMTLAEAVASLVERGVPVHLLCAGNGDQRTAVLGRLGNNATCPGAVATETVAKMHACADVFAFPSELDELGNVVQEALSSGVPVLLPRRYEILTPIRDGESGWFVPGRSPRAWADALETLTGNPRRLRTMGKAARVLAERMLPSWEDVLARDLLPVWLAAGVESGRYIEPLKLKENADDRRIAA
ncbi:MAG: glycosyltransferase, partial [Rhodospirillales bacterium]